MVVLLRQSSEAGKVWNPPEGQVTIPVALRASPLPAIRQGVFCGILPASAGRLGGQRETVRNE